MTGIQDLTKDNRSFFYPGVDASVVLTEAIPALKDNSVLSYAKVRGSCSKTGQISLSDWYATLPSFATATGFPYGTTTGYVLSNATPTSTTLSNPLLKPELTTEIEAGFELAFFKSRIGFDIKCSINQILRIRQFLQQYLMPPVITVHILMPENFRLKELKQTLNLTRS